MTATVILNDLTPGILKQKEMTKDDYVIDRISWPGKKEKPFVFESWENQDYSKVVHAIKNILKIVKKEIL